MNAKAFILEQLRKEEKMVNHLLVKRPKPNLKLAMAECESSENISMKRVQRVRRSFHAALVLDPYYLSPTPQKLIRLYEEYHSIAFARYKIINREHLYLTGEFLRLLGERGRQAHKSKELNPTVHWLEVQTIREEFIRLLTGKMVDPVVNKWREK